MFRLDGKIAAVTGSNGLLGKQFCTALAEYGATVLPLDTATGFNICEKALPPCDILVNAARTNWDTMYYACLQFQGSAIINIASIYGVVAPDPRIYEGTEINTAGVMYTTDKHAVVGLTKHLAVELAPKGIRVNAISPGGVENKHSEAFKNNYSKRVPMGRMAKPTEMNGALVFLASDASSYMTGQNIIVDGGLTIL